MADPKETEPSETPSEAPVTADASEPSKKASRTKAPRAQSKRSSGKAAAQSARATEQPPAAVRRTRKTYSEKDRSQKLGQIEKSIGRGESVKSAVTQVGISEQTYYQWKKAAKPVSESGGLKDLLALEEENNRLRLLLAERLRKENSELKKKLGLN